MKAGRSRACGSPDVVTYAARAENGGLFSFDVAMLI